MGNGASTVTRLLLVTPSTSYRTAAFLEAADRCGCAIVVATDAAPAIPGTSLHVSFEDPAVAAEQLIGAAGGVDGVVGTDGDAVRVAAAVGQHLGLASNGPEATAAAGNKHAQRIAARAAGIPQPTFALLSPDDDRSAQLADRETAWSSFPAVLKPLDRSASQGVVRVDDDRELAAGVLQVREIVGADSPILVEQFVAGTEVAVEGLLRGGRLEVIAVFDKPDTRQGPTFPETLLVSPARLDAQARAAVVHMAEEVTAALGLTEGPVHVEAKVDGTTVWFLEVAARTIGGLCSRALDHGGSTLEDLVVRHALGLPLSTVPDPGASGVLMLPIAKSGRLAGVHGVGRARSVDGVTDVVMSIGVGQDVVALPGGDRYLGFVFARADTPDAVEAALRRAWAEIAVDITAS